MYWATLLQRKAMYYPINPTPVSTRASLMGVSTIARSVTKESGQKSSVPPDYAGSPTPT